ncbi:class I SAM-dependent methyltransferase [Methanospirillum lacunae]|uniref:Class I SAM-dependent methyltransferase n=1 Tax=Methanospirillum lacunae TaxID=668570 RepID=A0A2V2MTG5_9EURY|nr:class I SAM-dependent methyltransferase [Methanospirillum lacunae]PWR71322.1 class I SAM-dependent methyltransferase [Methanospirillum lacunae]
MDEVTQKNSQLWADFWLESTKHNKNRGSFQSTFWDAMSSRFAKNRSPEKEEDRVKTVFDLIRTTGLELNGAEVLDIGAGTGSFSIPLAKLGARVTAIDFSEGMLKNLKMRADKENVPVRIMKKSWDEIDLDKEGFRNSFDLVIGSMTPAVSDPLTFDLMMNASRRVCYYSGWVNRKWDKAYYDLHKMLFNSEYLEGVHGIYLPFMYLYLQGYHPEIVISQDSWKNETTIDEMTDVIASHFLGSQIDDPQVKTTIRKYLVQHGTDGKYYEESVTTYAMMVWDKQKKIDSAECKI